MKITSIKDQPIKDSNSDLLEAEKYAVALSKFIIESDTPLTIGMQGEWGTGKTSLMYMLKEKIETISEGEDYAIATSWINTWEYSMFKGVEQTTPSVLKGMLENLKESCGDKWTLSDDIDSKIKKVGSFLGNVANQLVQSNTGINVKSAIHNQETQTFSDISEIKNDIKQLIESLISDEKNSYKKVVFFIDDLDRIEPSDAVEILEALKNIFDINNCLFILAIDYDVVVKGLEKKFGKKTELNEREFRSFFDKIIQVPFSMPTGAYDIQNFLDNKLNALGININEKLLPEYVQVVSNTVGFNPRSLKRYLNTFSLLRKISEMSEDVQIDEHDDFVLFNLIGLQVSYPKIFRLFNQFPEYLSWNEEVAAKLDLDLNQLEQSSKKFGESADEKWEQILFGISQPDPHLRIKWLNISKVLNNLRTYFKNDENELNKRIHAAMEFASMIGLHKSSYLFLQSKYADLIIKFRKNEITFLHQNGKKVANLGVFGRLGVTLNLLRTDENNFELPNIAHQVINARNDINSSEWYSVINISTLDDSLKKCFNDSYLVREHNKNTLKKDNPNIYNILGINK
jgi:Cdc6-like AAA superfamily ATPase